MLTVRRAIIGGMVIAAVIAVPLQLLIDPHVENLAAACLVLASSLLVFGYVSWSKALGEQPLSTLAIVGFCVTTQYGALIAQTLAWTALRTSLYDPIYTFGTLAFYQALGIAVHAAYRSLFRQRTGGMQPIRGALDWAGLYRIPSSRVLWLLGAIGLVSFYLGTRAGVLGKLGNGLNFLTWAPFLLPVYVRQFGDGYASKVTTRVLLPIYGLIVVALGLAMNMRQIMFYGVMNVGLVYLLIGLRSNAVVSRAGLQRCAVGIVAAIAMLGPVGDLATSMVIARVLRDKVTGMEMIRSTFEIWQQPHLIRAYRSYEKALSLYGAYDESYLANPVIARLVETKFHDNALHFARMLTSEDSRERLWRVTADSFWATLPTPLLNAMGIGVNKADLEFSLGDYLVYLSRGYPLGGYKIGSIFAHGLVLFGPAFPLVYMAICMLMFGLMNLLTIRSGTGAATISALGMMKLWVFFMYGVSAEGLRVTISFVTRDFLQMVLIYCFIYLAARFLMQERQSRLDEPVPA